MFFDFTKAFDNVPYFLLFKLSLGQDLLSWIHNYLPERSQCIIDEATSERVPVLSGAPLQFDTFQISCHGNIYLFPFLEICINLTC